MRKSKTKKLKRFIVETAGHLGLSHLYTGAFRVRFTILFKNTINAMFRQMAFNLFRGQRSFRPSDPRGGVSIGGNTINMETEAGHSRGQGKPFFGFDLLPRSTWVITAKLTEKYPVKKHSPSKQLIQRSHYEDWIYSYYKKRSTGICLQRNMWDEGAWA